MKISSSTVITIFLGLLVCGAVVVVGIVGLRFFSRVPENRAPEPEEITMDDFPGRDDAVLSDFTSRFNNLVQGGIEPEYVLLIVDNSGSMYTSHIEPHYSEATGDNFKEWITDSENYPNAVIKTQDGASDFTNERWLEAMRLLLEDALEEL